MRISRTRHLVERGSVVAVTRITESSYEMRGIPLMDMEDVYFHPDCPAHHLSMVIGYIVVESQTTEGPYGVIQLTLTDRVIVHARRGLAIAMEQQNRLARLYEATGDLDRSAAIDAVFGCTHRGPLPEV